MKSGVPHGLGKWKRDGRNHTVEGEWEDGLLNGRVVENYLGYHEYEAKGGKRNGKFIRYLNDGGRV